MGINTSDLAIFILGTLFTVIGSLTILILNGVRNEIKDIKVNTKKEMEEIKEIANEAAKSVHRLNINVAVVIDRTEHHAKLLESHHEEIKYIKQRI